MASRPEQLYKDGLLRLDPRPAAARRDLAARRCNSPLDLLHLAEEVEEWAAVSRASPSASSSTC